jgi:hypothetical protein
MQDILEASAIEKVMLEESDSDTSIQPAILLPTTYDEV